MARNQREYLGEAGDMGGGGAADTTGGATGGGPTQNSTGGYSHGGADQPYHPGEGGLDIYTGEPLPPGDTSSGSNRPVETLPSTGDVLPGLPAPISAPQVSLPNTPTSIGGTFALPGSAGAGAFRSPNFSMNRGLGTDATGDAGKKKRFSAGNAISGMDSGVATGVNPDELTRKILASLAGR